MRVLLASAVALLVALALAGAGVAGGGPFAVTGEVDTCCGSQGDGPSTPSGLRLSCAPGRRFAVETKLLNRSSAPVTLTGAVVDPPSARLIRRVAVQFRLAPPPAKGDVVVIGLRPWSRSAATPVTVPPGRSAWAQSNFLVDGCQPAIANRTMTIDYRADGRTGRQQIAQADARVVLTVPTVPVRTQQAIERRAGVYAYVPLSVPAGYRYYQWRYGSVGGLSIWFRHKGGSDITFNAGAQTNNCPGGKTLWLPGGKVYWSGNNENDQYVWLCVPGANGRVMQLTADSAPTGKGGPPAATLATVARSGRRIVR